VSDVTHPVWDVYDQFRTARLSCKYYSARLATLERANFWIELVLAATASGSAIAALTFWQTEKGKLAWTALTVLSAIVAVIKPLLKLPDRMTKFEELATGYGLLDNDYRKLEVSIRQKRAFDTDAQQRFQLLLDRSDELRKKEIVERQTRPGLRQKCQAEVATELPTDHFFVPEA
jgi:hypothetical protein